MTMNTRGKLYLAIALIALPCLAAAHNGRDVGTASKPVATEASKPGDYIVDIYQGIAVSVDPKTGARIYTQVGDIPNNPARARSTVAVSDEAGVGYWVDKSFQKNQGGYVPPPEAPAPQLSSYSDGYYSDYGYAYGGGYYGGYYGGGGGGRGGHGRPGGGDGRPGRPGGGDEPNPRPHGGGYLLQPGSNWSPPPGPYGGGVGSPPPYNDRGVGAPPPTLRYGGFRTRRG
jgi:hypothetical protein